MAAPTARPIPRAGVLAIALAAATACTSTSRGEAVTPEETGADSSPARDDGTDAPAVSESGVPDASPDAGDAGAPTMRPGEGNTGFGHTGVTLRRVPAEITSGTGWRWEGPPFNYVKITDRAARLDSVDIEGCVFIEAADAKISRSRIRCGANYIVRTDAAAATGLVIEDTELDGLGRAAIGIVAQNARLTRLNVHGFTGKGVMNQSDSVLEHSFVHGNVCVPPDHQSAVGTNGGSRNVVIRFNTIDLTPTACTSGGISNYDDFGRFENVTIEGNWIDSAGYCLKAGFEDDNAAGNSGMRVLGNVFGRKYHPQCGSFGVVSNWMPGVTGNVWSGNTWGDGAAADSTHAVGDTVTP